MPFEKKCFWQESQITEYFKPTKRFLVNLIPLHIFFKFHHNHHTRKSNFPKKILGSGCIKNLTFLSKIDHTIDVQFEKKFLW